jgi:hypothetical protein
MQGDGTHMPLIEVLVHLEQAGIVIEPGAQGLVKGRERITGDDRYRAMDLYNFTDGCMVSRAAC